MASRAERHRQVCAAIVNAIARSFGARALSFVPIAVAQLLATRLILEHFGITTLNAFALILTLINLVPLNNLGVGAAITSALAEDGSGSGRVERTVLTASRVLAVSSAGTAVVAMLLGVTGLWGPLLGQASGPDLWVGIALVIYAASFLPGLGQSMLLGIHRNHTTILIQAFFNPLNAIVVAVIIFTDSSRNIVVLVPSASLLVVNLITAAIAARATDISWRRITRRLLRRRRFPGAKIRAMSGPVLIITLSTPIALQSDRIVLSHVSTARAVAEYSVALQIFGPALVLIAATAQPLWPIWAQARAAGRRGPGVLRVVGLFSIGGAAVGVVLAALSTWVAGFVTDDKLQISPTLAAAGALGVLTAALSQPVAMSLMYPAGVKIVVWFTLIALPLNIGLSVLLGREYGAAGPLFASCIVGVLVQALPGLVISARRQRRELPGAAETTVPVAVGPVGEEIVVAAPEPAAPEPARRPSREAFRAGVAPYRAFRIAEQDLPQPEPARRPRPGPQPVTASVGRHARHARHESADAAAAVAAAFAGADGITSSADAYPDFDESRLTPVGAPGDPADSSRLQPVAPFRRPRDQRGGPSRPHR